MPCDPSICKVNPRTLQPRHRAMCTFQLTIHNQEVTMSKREHHDARRRTSNSTELPKLIQTMS